MEGRGEGDECTHDAGLRLTPLCSPLLAWQPHAF